MPKETICGHEPHFAKGRCRKCYAKEYYKRPEIKKHRKEYYKRAGEIQVKNIIKEYGLTYEEAIIIRNMRIELSFLDKKAVGQLLQELKTQEGEQFAEMVMDGIPQRKGIPFPVEKAEAP